MSEYSIKFKLMDIPPSVNSLYNVIFSLRKVELKPEVKIWKSKSKLLIPLWKPVVVNDNGFLYFNMDVYTNLYHKNGSVKKIDLGNMEKACLDVICEKIGIDDKFVVERKLRKIQSEVDYTICEIGFIT